MKISLQDAGKRYHRDWIFRGFTKDFLSGRSYVITGINGSGKSTLLQVIGGAVMQSEGKVNFEIDGRIDNENAYREIAIAAPYLDLPEEMTANEFLKFHRGFKKMAASDSEILSAVGLSNAAAKEIRWYSSGMKQRMKLAQAFFSETAVLLLDEPTANLDEEGIAIYQSLVAANKGRRTIIISSNDSQEYEFCEERISMSDLKRF